MSFDVFQAAERSKAACCCETWLAATRVSRTKAKGSDEKSGQFSRAGFKVIRGGMRRCGAG